jgi:hypothetical protein
MTKMVYDDRGVSDGYDGRTVSGGCQMVMMVEVCQMVYDGRSVSDGCQVVYDSRLKCTPPPYTIFTA